MRVGFCAAAVAFILGIGVAAAGYDDSWYEVPYWAGEYPTGFTVTAADVSIDIRSAPDRDLPRDIPCSLEQNGTYHPWNGDRVEADNLDFKSYFLIQDWEVEKVSQQRVNRQSDNVEVVLNLKPGQRWQYLAYMQEGWFVFRFDGETYEASQEFIEVSKEADPGPEPEHTLDEWMQLTCANGNKGWLLMSDTAEMAGLEPPNITEYGYSADRKP